MLRGAALRVTGPRIAVLAAVPSATIFRPSVMFGPEDQFTNRFAALARMSPVLPLIGGETKMQPVYVGDVATAIADAVDGKAKAGATYELGGPEVLAMREIIEAIVEIADRKPMLVPLLFGIIVIPLTFLGCVYYSWSSLEAIRWLQILVLVNPLVYMCEGFRAALTTGVPHMSLWAIYGALIGFGIVLTWIGVNGLQRRVVS